MFKQKFYLVIFAIYQLFSTALIAVGVWPANVVYLNLVLQLVAIFLFDTEYALHSVIVTLPFYLAVPNPTFDSLSAWRIVTAVLFLVFLYRMSEVKGSDSKAAAITGLLASPAKHSKHVLSKIDFSSWDKYLFWFFLTALASVLFAQFKIIGLKKLFFVINAYFIYIVALNVIRSRPQILRAIGVTFASLATIVMLGYVQFAATLTTSTYTFWQYWAVLISKAYYGLGLADTLVYSNSWFSFAAGQAPTLRMFSILPDSHAFGVIAFFSIPFAAALTFFAAKKWQKILLWIFIVLAALAIELSGTRGVWLGILAPVSILLYLYFKHYGRALIKPMFLPIIMFVIFVLCSPLIVSLASKLKGSANLNFGNSLQRAETIYNLNESSNSGRIDVWLKTIKYVVGHPIFGSGYGNFIVSLTGFGGSPSARGYSQPQNYQNLSQQIEKEFNLPKKYITAHSLYLDILAETGIVGFIFFLLYFKKIFRACWRFFKDKYLYGRDGYVFFVVNSWLYLAWLAAYSFFDGTLYNDRVLIYFFLILAICGSVIRVFSPPPPNQP